MGPSGGDVGGVVTAAVAAAVAVLGVRGASQRGSVRGVRAMPCAVSVSVPVPAGVGMNGGHHWARAWRRRSGAFGF